MFPKGDAKTMTDKDETNENASATDLSAMIEKLKKNPEIITTVTSMLGGAPQKDTEAPESRAAPSVQLPDIISAISPILSGGESPSAESDHRIALLCALRPYLNPERQEVIDYMMKFSKIGDLLKKLK